MFDQLRSFSEFDVAAVDVLLCTNTADIKEQAATIHAIKPLLASGMRVGFEVFSDLDDPWKLPWAHKPILEKSINSSRDRYSHFIYAEDDIRFTSYNFCYFTQYRPLLRGYGLVPSFLRYEFNSEKNGVFLTDIVWKNNIDLTDLVLSGQCFLTPSNPYCAMYVLDRDLGEEYVSSRSFTELASREVIGWPIADRSAMGMTFEGAPEGYRSRCVVPIDLASKMPSPWALVHHLPNNYTHRVWTEADKFHFGHTSISDAFHFNTVV